MDKRTPERRGPISQKQLHSPYAGWFDARALRLEYDRLANLLPTATSEIMRWRRNRMWQIEQRLKEIKADIRVK